MTAGFRAFLTTIFVTSAFCQASAALSGNPGLGSDPACSPRGLLKGFVPAADPVASQALSATEIEEKVNLALRQDPDGKWGRQGAFRLRPSEGEATSQAGGLSSGRPRIAASLDQRILVEVDGNYFFSHFYYRNMGAHRRVGRRYVRPKGVTFRKLNATQPVIRQVGSGFRVEYGTANLLLAESITRGKPEVVLLRGTSPKEWENIQEIRRAGKTQDPEWVGKFRKESAHKGIFFSPNEKGASTWSKGLILRMRIPSREFLSWAKEGRIYLGVEDDYIEAALIDERAISRYLERAEN
jgi:hypothetical protein